MYCTRNMTFIQYRRALEYGEETSRAQLILPIVTLEISFVAKAQPDVCGADETSEALHT